MERRNWVDFLKYLRLKGADRVPAFRLLSAVVLFMTWSCAVMPASAQESPSSFVPIAPEILSNSFIRCFYKDQKGYVWIGTEDALIRYDGSNAYRYVHDPEDRSSLSHNTINAIVEGKDKQLWIGTAQGICIYNPDLDNFINVDSIKGNKNYLNNRYITDLEFDSQGLLWIGTHEGGINIYDPGKREFAYIIDPPQGGVLPANNFLNVLTNIGDTMWCASKGGLLLYDTKTRHRLSLNTLARFKDVQISSIASEKSGSLLIATTTGAITRVIQKGGTYSFQELLRGSELGESANRILTLCFDQKGNILVGGENSGVNSIDPTTGKVRRLLNEHQIARHLSINSIQSIYADDLGLIWIGTFNNGAFLLNNNRRKFESSETSIDKVHFGENEVRSFAEDRFRNIWVAVYGVGLARIDSKTHSVQLVDAINRNLSNKNITSIICDRHDQLWLGTAGKGVFRIDPRTNKLYNYSIQSDGFGNDQVFCLYEDRSGVVWAGTWGSGLFVHDKINDKFVSRTEYDQPNHIPNTGYVSDIIEDSEGTFWVGTLYGLYELKRKVGNSFTYQLHLPGNDGSIKGTQIQAIVEDNHGDLWVGTPEGLNLKKKGAATFKVYQADKGTVANTIRSILPDDKGYIWMGGNSGISKFDINAGTFINYTREDGLRSNNFHRRSALASSEGKFYFGSNNGFDSFYPDSIRTASARAKVVLSDLKINNQSVRPGAADSPLKKHISLTSDLELSYEQRSFVINFVALDYTQAANHTYCYKLEGFDDDWNCNGPNHSATYTNIDPGHYVFLVKAANRDGVWLDTPLRLEITIQQVFWKTWWAFTIYVAIVILLIYVLVKIRVERLKMKNEIMLEKLKREQEHELSELKTQFFTNVAHEFRTPLSLILVPLESLMGTNEVPTVLRERIFTAYKNADRMARLVNELMDFNKLEVGNFKLNVQHAELVQFILETSGAFNEMAAKRKISFSVNAETPVIMGWFDRDKLERVIFNLLSNAFKFTADGGGIKLQINVKHSVGNDGALCRCVELVIEDNGIGILPDELPHIFDKFYQAKSSSKISSPGTGIGLSLTKALVELHQGTITVESVPDRATVFTILLPIDANVYQQEENVVTPPDVVYMPRTDDDIVVGDQDESEAGSFVVKPKILVVEDNEELRKYLVSELQSEFLVFEAEDGTEGIAIALEKNPDLIVSDIMMPRKDGIEFCQAIKTDINTSHIPFILLTAKATVADQIHGVTTGADLYVSKPFNIRYLIAHIRQIISSRRKLYTRFSQDVYLMPVKATSNELDQAFLQKAIDYVVSNLQDPQLSVDSIAALYNLSRMQAYRKIKALTGKSVVEFIKMVRMKEAIKLMDEHKLTLSEIAFEVGFNSASYFTRCFKDEYGKTPSEYWEQG